MALALTLPMPTRRVAFLRLVGSVLEVERDPPPEAVELAVLVGKSREEGRDVVALVLELLVAAEPDEQVEIDGRGRDDLHLLVIQVDQLVVVHVRDMERRTRPDVVAAPGDEGRAAAAQDVERLLTVAMPSRVRAGRDDDLAQVRAVRREADLLADEHRQSVLVRRLDPGQVAAARDDRGALDVRGIALAGGAPVGREVGRLQAGDGPPGFAHSSPAGLSGWRSIWCRPSALIVNVSWIAR